MIQGMTKLQQECRECGKRADYKVTRTNDELKDKRNKEGYRYITDGVRELNYCSDCLPEDAATFWNGAIPDMPHAHLEKGKNV